MKGMICCRSSPSASRVHVAREPHDNELANHIERGSGRVTYAKNKSKLIKVKKSKNKNSHENEIYVKKTKKQTPPDIDLLMRIEHFTNASR